MEVLGSKVKATIDRECCQVLLVHGRCLCLQAASIALGSGSLLGLAPSSFQFQIASLGRHFIISYN